MKMKIQIDSSIMAAEGDNNITWFTYAGADGEVIPDDATHVFVDVKIIL